MKVVITADGAVRGGVEFGKGEVVELPEHVANALILAGVAMVDVPREVAQEIDDES